MTKIAAWMATTLLLGGAVVDVVDGFGVVVRPTSKTMMLNQQRQHGFGRLSTTSSIQSTPIMKVEKDEEPVMTMEKLGIVGDFPGDEDLWQEILWFQENVATLASNDDHFEKLLVICE